MCQCNLLSLGLLVPFFPAAASSAAATVVASVAQMSLGEAAETAKAGQWRFFRRINTKHHTQTSKREMREIAGMNG